MRFFSMSHCYSYPVLTLKCVKLKTTLKAFLDHLNVSLELGSCFVSHSSIESPHFCAIWQEKKTGFITIAQWPTSVLSVQGFLELYTGK